MKIYGDADKIDKLIKQCVEALNQVKGINLEYTDSASLLTDRYLFEFRLGGSKSYKGELILIPIYALELLNAVANDRVTDADNNIAKIDLNRANDEALTKIGKYIITKIGNVVKNRL